MQRPDPPAAFGPSFEGVVTFAGGGCAAIARIDADSFEEAASHILLRVSDRKVKSIEITDLRYEDEEAVRAAS